MIGLRGAPAAEADVLQRRPLSQTAYQDPSVRCPVCGAANQNLTLCGGGSWLSVPRRLRLFSQNGANGLLESMLFQCGACSLRYLYPQPTRQILEEHYRNAAVMHGTYTPERFVAAVNNPDNAASAAAVVGWLRETFGKDADFLKGGLFVDVGCNAAGFLKAVRDMGAACLGIEVDPRLCEWNKAHLGIDVFAGMFEDVPASYHGSAAVVVIRDSLEHHLDPVATLTLARRLLKDGGLVFVDVPNLDCMLAQHNIDAWDWFEADHLMYFSPPSIRTAFERAGLTGVAVAPAPASDFDRGDAVLTGLAPADVSWDTVRALVAQGRGRKLWCAGMKREAA